MGPGGPNNSAPGYYNYVSVPGGAQTCNIHRKLEKIDVTVTRKSGQLFKQLEERTSFIFTYLASKVHMFLFYFL